MAVIVWFRRDLRMADNPALAAAAASGEPVIPLYLHDEANAPGAASRWWLRLSAALDRLMDKPLPPKAREVRALLVLGCAQVAVLDVPNYAVVAASVEAAISWPYWGPRSSRKFASTTMICCRLGLVIVRIGQT